MKPLYYDKKFKLKRNLTKITLSNEDSESSDIFSHFSLGDYANFNEIFEKISNIRSLLRKKYDFIEKLDENGLEFGPTSIDKIYAELDLSH